MPPMPDMELRSPSTRNTFQCRNADRTKSLVGWVPSHMTSSSQPALTAARARTGGGTAMHGPSISASDPVQVMAATLDDERGGRPEREKLGSKQRRTIFAHRQTIVD